MNQVTRSTVMIPVPCDIIVFPLYACPCYELCLTCFSSHSFKASSSRSKITLQNYITEQKAKVFKYTSA